MKLYCLSYESIHMVWFALSASPIANYRINSLHCGVNKEILRLAVPNIISNISVPLLSTVDTVLMGQISGLHLGAVGIGTMIFNFFYWNFGFLRMGTTGLTAQAFGKKDRAAMATSLARALLTGLAIGLLIIILQKPIWLASSTLMNIADNHFQLARQYYAIRILAAPATLALYSILGWYFGMQNAVYPLVITLFLNISNILLSALFVLYYNMEVEGVAYGTLIAQYAGLVLALLLLLKKYPAILRQMKYRAIFIRKEIFVFFQLNKDIFLRTFCLSFVFAFFYSQSSKSGELVLASSVILLQFLNWMSYGIDGFAFAAESLTGKYYGANNSSRLHQTIRYSFFWGAALALLFTLSYWMGSDFLIRVFTSDVQVIAFTKQYYFWVIIMPLVGFSSYIWDGIYVGLTAGKSMRNSMFLSFIIHFILYYALKSSLGPHALWIALLGFLLSRALIQTALFANYGIKIK